MGARFAPSVANIFMALWEEDFVFGSRPVQLVCYQRYIDDLFMIWERDMISLQLFMSKLNGNNKGIHLSWNADIARIAFLDLEIFKQEDRFLSRNYFIATDRNRFIPLDSCHHHSWLYNVPKGQFIHLRRNCALDSDYFSRANVLADRFLQKGYTKEHITGDMVNVGNLERTSLVADSDNHQKSKDDFGYKVILDYNIQYKKFERIVSKHWDILKKDSVLGAVFPPCPKFVYRKPPTLRDILAPSVVVPLRSKRKTGFSTSCQVFNACGKCPACKQCRHNLKRRKDFSASATSKYYQIKHLITCNTVGVVYNRLQTPIYRQDLQTHGSLHSRICKQHQKRINYTQCF